MAQKGKRKLASGDVASNRRASHKYEFVEHPAVTLPLHHPCLGAVFRKVQDLENVLVFTVTDRWGALHLAEMIHAKVVGNPHGPGKKLPFVRITAAANGINYSDENILEDIFGKVLVFNQEENGSVKFVLVTQYQGLQGVSVTGHERVDKLVVGQFR
jgi:hypothetical protein